MDYSTIAQLARKGATRDQISQLSHAGMSLAEIKTFYGISDAPSEPKPDPSMAGLTDLIKKTINDALAEKQTVQHSPSDFSQAFSQLFPGADVPPERDVQQMLNDRFAELIGGEGKGGSQNG